MPDTSTISKKQARRLAIAAQGLDERHRQSGVMGVAGKLGCIQFDPLNVVARTQLLVLHSRLGPFDPAELDRALFEDKTLFHYWAHAASFVLTDDFPIYKQQMVAWARDKRFRRAHEWIKDNATLRRSILRALKSNGPMAAREFEDHSKGKWRSTGWTEGQSVTRMLDFLWIEGKVTIAGRQGLQRIWALTDDWLPPGTDQRPLSDDEAAEAITLRGLQGLGVGTFKQIAHHFVSMSVADTREVVRRLVERGEVVEVAVADTKGPWFMRKDDLPLLDEIGSGWKVPTTPLSPFDNLIRDRERTKTLFDLDFSIEIYVPKAKRRYGYYVLPIIDGDEVVALVDPKMDRKAGILNIQSLHLGPGRSSTAVAKRVDRCLRNLGKWLGATEVVYGDIPKDWRAVIG